MGLEIKGGINMYKIHEKECIDICNDFVPFYQMEPSDLDIDYVFQNQINRDTEATAIAKNYSSCAIPESKDVERCKAMKKYTQQKLENKELIKDKLQQRLNCTIKKTGQLSSILEVRFELLFRDNDIYVENTWYVVYYKEIHINPRKDDFSKIDKFIDDMNSSALYVKKFIHADANLDLTRIRGLCYTNHNNNLTRSQINKNAVRAYKFKWDLVYKLTQVLGDSLEESKLNVPLTIKGKNIVYTNGYIIVYAKKINMEYSEPYHDDFLFTHGKQTQVIERIVSKVYDEAMGIIGAYEERKRREEEKRREKEKREIEARIARQKEYEEREKARIERDKLYDEERKKYEQIKLSILSKYNSLGFILNDGKPNKVTIISNGNQKEINLKIDIHYYDCGLELPLFKGRLELTLDNGISIIIRESNPTQYSSSQL